MSSVQGSCRDGDVRNGASYSQYDEAETSTVLPVAEARHRAQVPNGDDRHDANAARDAMADTAAEEELGGQLHAARARLAEAAEEAADLRNQLTALTDAEAARDAAQAQASELLMLRLLAFRRNGRILLVQRVCVKGRVPMTTAQ